MVILVVTTMCSMFAVAAPVEDVQIRDAMITTTSNGRSLSFWKLFTRQIAPDEEFVRLHRRMSARRRHP